MKISDMIDFLRENMSYPTLVRELLSVKREILPVRVRFGRGRDRYILHYAPKHPVSDKVILWIHGGGWYSGSPRAFDAVGQCIAGVGYHFVSIGYRLAPFNKYPRQIIDVCIGFECAMEHLEDMGIDTSKVIVTGSSAGAHLASILCYSRSVQRKMAVDVSGIIGCIGIGGPYSFSTDRTGPMIRLMLAMLFKKGYDRRRGEPLYLMGKSRIPMLLIHSKHDGLISFGCAEDMCKKAARIGCGFELYPLTEKRYTHSMYTIGIFTHTRDESPVLDKFLSWIEAL